MFTQKPKSPQGGTPTKRISALQSNHARIPYFISRMKQIKVKLLNDMFSIHKLHGHSHVQAFDS